MDAKIPGCKRVCEKQPVRSQEFTVPCRDPRADSRGYTNAPIGDS
ncbi:hypothetical protein B8V81_0896 [Paenibacillus pasadenensis]|uniref:Uncharacterized protein n=1 Tax=Paenibacillus pasadenensis TaxID=217090 RepID=A0A2N5N8L1_9BACL|nr:hypothetical protein B8V81_0896 [Paenibacillus pasadenensis]